MSIEPQQVAADEGHVSPPPGVSRRGSGDASPSALRLDVRRERDRGLVRPWGEVDPATAARVDHALRELQAVGFDHLILDLRRVSLVDGAALRVLLGARTRARARGTRLEVLCAAGQLVERLLALTDADQPIGNVAHTSVADAGARLVEEQVDA